MIACREDPASAYRRSAFDARVRAARNGELVLVCFEQVRDGLALALRGDARGHNATRAEGLTRAHAAIVALEMGIDRSAPLAGALDQVYAGARAEVLAAVTDFSAPRIERVLADFSEIGEVLRAA